MKFGRDRYGSGFDNFIKYVHDKPRVCVYCKCRTDEPTREHVPSKFFFDKPYPCSYPTVPACFECNNSYSDSEQHLVCLVETIKQLFTERNTANSRVLATLDRNSILKNKIKNEISTETNRYIGDGRIIDIVLEKLALGHWAYEVSDPAEYALQIHYKFLYEMSGYDFQNFNALPVVYDLDSVYPLPGIGSLLFRSFFILTTKTQPLALFYDKWFVMKDKQYRYCIDENLNNPTVKIVISEFLFCEVKLAHRYAKDTVTIPKACLPQSYVPILKCSYQEALQNGRCHLRTFTPREYYRLQGFDDDSITKALLAKVDDKFMTDGRHYRLASDSINVHIVTGIAKKE